MPANTMESKETSTTDYRAEGIGKRTERPLAPMSWEIIITWLVSGKSGE